MHRVSLWKILRLYGLPTKIIEIIECSVIVGNNTTEWFPVTSGLKQGCLMSPLLFLVAIDWIMRETTKDESNGIRWKMDTKLDDLDYADDLCLISPSHQNICNKTEKLHEKAAHMGLNINLKKTKVMRINARNNNPVKVYTSNLEDVLSFTYLGSTTTGGTDEDITARINKARYTFSLLKPVWNSSQLSNNTKIKIFNNNVKCVLLYGSECWKIIKDLAHKLRVFINRCLRTIYKTRWPRIISNKALMEKARQQDIMVEIAKRKWRWIGHVLRKDQNDITREAILWAADGKRKHERPKMTWRRTAEKELKEHGLTWRLAEAKVWDRAEWRGCMDALSACWREED